MKGVNILGKMTVRDICKNLMQYLAMIIITMLAVTLFCGFISNAATLKRNLNNYYEETNLTDLICQYSALSNADKVFLESLDTYALEYRIYTEGVVGRRNAKFYVCNENNAISLPLVIKGERGVLIDRYMAKNDNISIGDTLYAQVQTSANGGKISLSFTVTGLMTFAEAANTGGYCPVYIDSSIFFRQISPNLPADTVESLFNSNCNQALIKTNSAITKQQITNHYANQNSSLMHVLDRDSLESVVMLNNEISQSLKMIYVFPVIFMLVSVLVILSTISPMILKERINIGTLKSIGLSNRRILMHYSMFGTILCFIGGAIGVFLGPLIIPNALLVKYSLVYSLPDFSGVVFSFLWSIVAVAAVCTLAALIGFLVCRKTCTQRPAACMRPLPPKESFIINKSRSNVKKISTRALPFKMAFRNIAAKPARAFMTMLGVMGCVALLVCSFGIGDTVNNSIDYELGVQFSYDISTIYTADAAKDFVEAMDELIKEGRVAHYETYKTLYVQAKGERVKDITMFFMPQNPKLTTINPNGKTLISKSLAEDLGVKEGGTVTVSTITNSYNFVIDQIIQTASTKGIFVSDEAMFSSNQCTLKMMIKADSPEELLDYVNSLNGTNSAFTMNQSRQSVTNLISSIQTIKLTMMIFSIALAVVVLYNLSLLGIKERTRDIATMKVLGFTIGQIGRSLLYEIMMLVALGTLIGVFLGYPITILVMSINRVELITFIYRIKPLSYAIAAFISLATALAINLFFIRPIKKINMTQSLKSVE